MATIRPRCRAWRIHLRAPCFQDGRPAATRPDHDYAQRKQQSACAPRAVPTMARVAIVWQHRIIAETRVGREIGALAEAGHEVDVICLRAPGEARFERRGPVTFRRLSLQTR